MRDVLVLAAIAGILAASPARAQDDSPLVLQTGRELLSDTSLYMERTVVVIDGYCFFDEPSFVCLGAETPFEVKSPALLQGPLSSAIKEKCGDIQGAEHNPTPACAYSFRFVPRSFKPGIGDYILHDRVQSNKRILYIQADVIEPLAR